MFEWNTIHGALEALFPLGTNVNTRTYHEMPKLQTDLFAAAAYLLERGGVYHRIIPDIEVSVATRAHPSGPPYRWDNPNLLISSEIVRECQRLGQNWYRSSLSIRSAAQRKEELGEARGRLEETLKEIETIWKALIECHHEPVVQRPRVNGPLNWWLPALKLLIVSDEASAGLGYQQHNGDLSHPLEDIFGSQTQADGFFPMEDNPNHVMYRRPRSKSFAPRANPHLVRVVPKSRTPSVGCTMRTLSHNLALVPPEGIVDVNWYREIHAFPEDREPLNLLLVPFPYQVPATAFKAIVENSTIRGEQRRWGWFHIAQTWLAPETDEPRVDEAKDATTKHRELFADFIAELIQAAERDVGRVHGVIMPELSLDWPSYAAIIRRIQHRSEDRCRASRSGHRPMIDFFVSGTSNDVFGSRGNFASTTTFRLNDSQTCVAFTNMRAKHHRWQLSENQISDYALGSALDPNVIWWEGNELPRREIDLNVFRRGAVFSVMICEDLARSEPCHEPLRSVGPNLVFVLLMDGPQIPGRWSARYATALADDPGSSVLTLTSLGLMERTNRAGHYQPCHKIGIWKDDTGHTVQIDCPRGAHAVLITLAGKVAEESTLDGRPNKDTQAWRYHGHQPVRLPEDYLRVPEISWIVGRG